MGAAIKKELLELEGTEFCFANIACRFLESVSSGVNNLLGTFFSSIIFFVTFFAIEGFG